MSDARYLLLDDRGIIAVRGPDARVFLQGIVSTDVNKVTPDHAGYGAFLTPQGKYLADFFIVATDSGLLLDCERSRIPDFAKRLKLYKLRSKVEIEDESDSWDVAAAFGDGALDALGLPSEAGTATALAAGIVYVDPRLAAAGARAVMPRGTGSDLQAAGLEETRRDAFDHHRIALGLPDGTRDLVVEKSVLLENGFDELNGIDWQKGCYMGQEVTARTKHRGLVKKRLVPVAISGAAPEPGTPVMAGDREAGEMRSAAGDVGLALLRLDYIKGTRLTAGDAELSPRKPEWATF